MATTTAGADVGALGGARRRDSAAVSAAGDADPAENATAAEATTIPPGADEFIELDAPPGPLGLFFDGAAGTEPILWKVGEESALAGQVPPGARLLAVDETSTREHGGDAVRELLLERKERVRRLRFAPQAVELLPPGISAAAAEAAAVPTASLDEIADARPLEGVKAAQSDVLVGSFGGRACVVKTAKAGATARDCGDLLREAAMLRALPAHPHVVALVATAAAAAPRPFVVLEFLSGRTLEAALNQAARDAVANLPGNMLLDALAEPESPSTRSRSSSGFASARRSLRRLTMSALRAGEPTPRWTMETALDVSVQMLHGLCHLHAGGGAATLAGCGVVHRDLKPANIFLVAEPPLPRSSVDEAEPPPFVSQRFRVKVLDLGLAAVVPRPPAPPGRTLTAEVGSLRWMAPEVALGRDYGFAADVHSTALVVWSAAAVGVPFSGLDVATLREHVHSGGHRPPIREGWPLGFGAVLRGAWAYEPTVRPTMEEMRDGLAEILVLERFGAPTPIQPSVEAARASAADAAEARARTEATRGQQGEASKMRAPAAEGRGGEEPLRWD